MPTPELILSRLSQAATDLVPLAFVWHGPLLTAAVALLAGWCPARRTAASLLTAPMATTLRCHPAVAHQPASLPSGIGLV